MTIPGDIGGEKYVFGQLPEWKNSRGKQFWGDIVYSDGFDGMILVGGCLERVKKVENGEPASSGLVGLTSAGRPFRVWTDRPSRLAKAHHFLPGIVSTS